jgi:hypothetical protein
MQSLIAGGECQECTDVTRSPGDPDDAKQRAS